MVQQVDRVATLLPAMDTQMWRMIGRTVFTFDDIEGPMGHISGISLSERATTARKRGIRVNGLGPVLLGQNIQGSVRPISRISLSEGATSTACCIPICHIASYSCVEARAGCGNTVCSCKDCALVPLGLRGS